MKTDRVWVVNRDYYKIDRVVERYASDLELLPVEAALLKRLAPFIENRRVLDIGVGPGRTTHTLYRLSPQYIGIDYSEAMLRPCRQRYPGCSLMLCDARMLCFPGGTLIPYCFSPMRLMT